MNKFQALHSFWSSFEIPAYDENSVPSGANKPDFPYITYDAAVSGFGASAALTGSLWYYGSSWEDITEKLAEIEAKVSRGGVTVSFENGALWLKPGVPFAQRMADPDFMVRRIYINLEAEYISAD